jgi:DNA-directed RNA polymerase subunit RPC12/RpoP
MQIEYQCLDCDKSFPIDITDEEYHSCLSNAHAEVCPQCGRKVGTGSVKCTDCGTAFVLRFVHWHVTCDLTTGNCPKCGKKYVELCIC